MGLICLLLAAVAVPSAASAASLVPPGNSAVNQYTETWPSAGGGATGNDAGGRTPSKVLGARNAHRLEAMGSQGRAAAELATATAPGAAIAGRSPRTGGPGGRGSSADVGTQAGEPGVPSGSSGLSEVLRQATGSTSSGGLLLPLVVLATLGLSAAYAWRRLRRTP